jgi:excisionase family DNA binding protein
MRHSFDNDLGNPVATTIKTTPTSEPDHGPFVPADAELAALKRAAQALRTSESGSPKLVAANGDELELPPTLLRVLRLSAETLADARAVLLDSLGKQISPHQAAELLGFSVTYVEKLLEDGTLPFTQVGDVRRMSLIDVLAFRDDFRRQRRAALSEIARLGQEMGLDDPDLGTIELRRLAEFDDEAESFASRS